MIKLLDGNFEYKGYKAEIHEFEGKYFGKVNLKGVYENFEADSDDQAFDGLKSIVNDYIASNKK